MEDVCEIVIGDLQLTKCPEAQEIPLMKHIYQQIILVMRRIARARASGDISKAAPA